MGNFVLRELDCSIFGTFCQFFHLSENGHFFFINLFKVAYLLSKKAQN